MSEQLAQLEKKGGKGKVYYGTQSVANSTRYEFNCGFKPDCVWFRFYGNNKGNYGRMLLSSNDIQGIWKNGPSGSIYSDSLSASSTMGITNNGFWVLTDNGSMSGNIEYTAVQF